jgi:diguanylate cyclase (GGDEF)-like protein
VREALEKGQIIFEGARLAVTASFGLAVWPGDGREAATLLASADRALYSAKQAGRNRVVSAGSLAEATPS